MGYFHYYSSLILVLKMVTQTQYIYFSYYPLYKDNKANIEVINQSCKNICLLKRFFLPVSLEEKAK